MFQVSYRGVKVPRSAGFITKRLHLCLGRCAISPKEKYYVFLFCFYLVEQKNPIYLKTEPNNRQFQIRVLVEISNILFGIINC